MKSSDEFWGTVGTLVLVVLVLALCAAIAGCENDVGPSRAQRAEVELPAPDPRGVRFYVIGSVSTRGDIGVTEFTTSDGRRCVAVTRWSDTLALDCDWPAPLAETAVYRFDGRFEEVQP